MKNKIQIAKPAADLVDLTNYFSEACGGRETQGVEKNQGGTEHIRTNKREDRSAGKERGDLK